MSLKKHYDQLVSMSDWDQAIELDEQTVGGYWVLQEDLGVLPAGSKVAAILYYLTGIEIVCNDWQSIQPDMSDLDDIAEAAWVDVDGWPVVMIDGLPVRVG